MASMPSSLPFLKNRPVLQVFFWNMIALSIVMMLLFLKWLFPIFLENIPAKLSYELLLLLCSFEIGLVILIIKKHYKKRFEFEFSFLLTIVLGLSIGTNVLSVFFIARGDSFWHHLSTSPKTVVFIMILCIGVSLYYDEDFDDFVKKI